MNDDQLLRYHRQILLPEFDATGQQRLLDSHAVIIGLGGLGSPAALYLAAAGVGRLTLVDHDQVELSNLQRQIIHDESTVGMEKTSSAEERLKKINHETEIDTIDRRLDDADMLSLFSTADIVLDGTDNFTSRQQINRISRDTSTPIVSGAAIRFEGQLSIFDPTDPDCPCYACVYGSSVEDTEQTCSENGVLSPVVGIIGSMMANETIKHLAGIGDTLTRRMLLIDALDMNIREMRLKRDPGCEMCGG